ncbi:MAG: sensor histidine kinase [Sphaerochaetaceae bacterium]|jgi:hypothetical protein|nr:sensor histidine kinase [Sphaerochaetaceae bacterium]MDD3162475.1 sensor histidine kinase [Sphaerochaetaceae bacterium]MDD4006803.1 sensor histidine kinase [Sphaerochaetaceae bacterium]MDD4396084.1 sensor histidine kinase [Sphaerochaetaceae bacterium]
MHVFLCDFLLDIAQNSLEADSTLVQILISETPESIRFRIEDNGKGMSEETQKKVTDPFYTDGVKHKKRKVGLGLPFVIQTGKDFSLNSSLGKGTVVQFSFDLTDIDVPPLGDLPSTILAIFSGAPDDCDVVVTREISSTHGDSGYKVSRSSLIEALGELRTAGSQNLARQYLDGLEEDLKPYFSEHVFRIPE